MSWATITSYLRIPILASSGIAALGSSLLYFRQNSLIYPASILNSRTEVPQPSQFKISPDTSESLHLTTSDNETLHAYYLRPPNVQLQKNVTILMFHGNAGNIGHRLPIAKALSESLGCHVFMLEYRGYGLSTGSPDENGLNIDSQTALDFVRSHPEMSKTKIVVYGQSLGGAVSIALLARNLDKASNDKEKKAQTKIAGMILENTFTSIRKLIPSVLPPARYLSLLCHQRWSSDEVLQKLPEDGPPILFLSGLKDEIVPPTMMRTLYEVCTVKRKTWKTFPNGDHNSTVAEDGYFYRIWDWLSDEVLKESDKEKGTGFTDVNQEELWA